MTGTDDCQRLEQRIVALEEWVTHTDRLLQQYNEVLCTIQDRLDDQQRSIARFQNAVERLAHGENDDRTLEEERPPHY